MTPDRLFYPLAALVVGGLIALAMIYPQGEGARSPGPFGHIPTQQAAAAVALAHRNAAIAEEQKKAALALQNQRAHDAAALRTTPLK